jgi:hypothetical protein
MMRLLRRAAFGCAVLLLGLAWLVFSTEPLVTAVSLPSPWDMARARMLLAQHDPRAVQKPIERVLMLTQRDLDLLANYVGQRGQATVATAITPGVLIVRASRPIWGGALYLNVEADFIAGRSLLQARRVQIGGLPLPAGLVQSLLERELRLAFGEFDVLAVAQKHLRELRLDSGSLMLRYQVSEQLVQQLRRGNLVLPPADVLFAYHERLGQVVAAGDTAAPLRAVDLLRDLFQLAAQRATTGTARIENRAALIVLGAYLDDRGLAGFVPEARSWQPLRRRRVELAGRTDFPQHFVTSAAIAAEAGERLADALGIYKEIADTNFGSGFSFTDLAVDRAGAKFGTIAVASESSARALQARIAAGVEEQDLLPVVADLPEFLKADEFRARFQAVDSAPYRAQMAEIDRRVGATALYRALVP